MADTDANWISPFSGAATPVQDAPPAERGFGGWAKDTGIDVLRGGLGIARDITGAKAAISTAAPGMDTKRQTDNLTTGEDIDYFLKRAKTETGQYRDAHPELGWGDHPVGKTTEVAAGLAAYAPMAVMSGPAAPLVFGGLAYGHAQSELHERLRDAPEEELMKTPDYKQYRDTGMSDQAARDQLFVDGSDPTKLKNLLAVLPAVAGNVIGGGIGGIMLSKAAQRTVNDWITDRILRNLHAEGAKAFMQRRAFGAGEAALGGAAGMGGNEATRQLTEQNVGLRPPGGFDYGKVFEQMGEGAATFAVPGLAGTRKKPTYREFGPETTPRPGTPGPMPEAPDDGYGPATQPASRPGGGGGGAPPGHADDLGVDTAAVATAQQQPAGPSGGGPGGEYGPSVTPSRRRPVPGREMVEGDVQPPVEHGWPDVTRPGEEPYAPPQEPAPYRVPQPGEERPPGYDPNQPGGGLPQEPPRPHMPGPMPDEGGGIGERPLQPEFPEVERPGMPRGEEFGGERTEGEIPYADRGRLRQALGSKAPQTRGVWADQLEHQLNRGVTPSLKGKLFAHIRNMLGKDADFVNHLLQTSPRGVVAEMRSGIEAQPGVERLSGDHTSALHEVMAKVDPEVAHGWATEIQNRIDAGARTLPWNKLPQSMRAVLGEHRAAIVDAARRNPREVADVLAGRAHTPEARRYREAGTRDVVERTTHEQPEHVSEADVLTEDQPQGQRQEEVHPGEEFLGHGTPEELAAQAQEQRLAAQFGPAVEPAAAPYLTRRHRRHRVGTERDIGISRSGRIAPEAMPRMQGTLGRTLTMRGTSQTRLQAVLRRAAERREAREAERVANVGNRRPHPESADETRTQHGPIEGVEDMGSRAEREATQRHKERIAADQRRQQEREQAADRAVQDSLPRRVLNQTVEIVGHLREFATRAAQRAMERTPFHREMARAEAIEQARLDKDAARKRRTRRGDLEYRERVAKNVLTDEHLEFISEIDDLLRDANRPISPTGQRYTSTERARTRATEEEMRRAERTDQRAADRARREVGEQPDWRVAEQRRQEEIAKEEGERQTRERQTHFGTIERLDDVSREALMGAATRLVDAMKARLDVAKEAMDQAMIERTRPGQKPRIGWGLPTVRSGLHPWYDRLADLNRYATALQREINKGKGKGGSTEIVRTMMANIWLREHMLREGRIAEFEEYTRAEQQMTFNEIATRLVTLQNELNRRMQPRSEGFSGRRESALRSEIEALQRLQHAMQDIGGKDVVDFELQIAEMHEDSVAQMLREHQRRMIVEYVRDRLSGMTEEQQVQEQRELALKRRESEQRNAAKENPQTPPRAERLQRLHDLDERGTQIMEALDNIPSNRTGRIRESIDTLRYRTARPGEQPEAVPRPQMTEVRLNEMITRLHRELTEVENESRTLAQDLNPKMLRDEYGLAGVLDPAADLTRSNNLPKGSYAKRVNDFLSGRDSIRPKGGGTVLDAGGRTKFRPADPAARLINHYLDVVGEVSGDAHVVVLTDEQMQMASRQRGLPPDTPAFYDVKTHRILIGREVMHGPERTRTLMHELGHPMIEAAIQRFPEIGRRLDAIRKIVQQEWMNGNPEVSDALGYNTHAFENVHEFVTELYSDGGKLAEALQSIKTSEAERAQFQTARAEGLLARTLHTIKRGLTNLFFSVSKKRLLNDATINSLELFDSIRKQGRVRPRSEDIARPITAEAARDWAVEKGKDASDRFRELKTYLGSGNLMMQFRDMSSMEHIGSEGMRPHTKALSQIADRINATARKHEHNPEVERIGNRLADLERVNKRAYDELMNYQADATHWQVHGGDPLFEGRNKHISRDSVQHGPQRDIHAELRGKWDAMTPLQKGLWEDMQGSYRQKHDAVLHETVGMVVDAKKLIPDGAPGGIRSRLVRYILDGEEGLSDREKRALTSYVPGYNPADTALHAAFKADIAKLRAMPAFKRLPIFSPAIREGNYVVEARYDMSGHAQGGTQLAREDGKPSGHFEFPTAAARDTFMRSVHNDPKFKGVRLMDASDVVYAKDANGQIMRDANGKAVPLTEYRETTRRRGDEMEPGYTETTTGAAHRVRPADAGNEGVVRYQARYNPLLLEFHERQLDAQNRHMELQQEAAQGHLKLSDVQPIRDFRNNYVDPVRMDQIHRELQDSVTNSRGWREMDTTTRAMVLKDLQEAAVRTMASTSARSMLPRHFALGARKSMLRDFMEYHRRAAHTLSGLQHRTELGAAMKAMDQYVNSTQHWGSPQDPQGKFGIVDARVAKSMRERLMRPPNEMTEPFWTKAMTTVLRVSYLDKLMSPAFTVLQAIEPWIVMAPALAGQYGFKAYPAIWRAMRDLKAARTMGVGFRDAGGTFKRMFTEGPNTFLKQTDLISRLKDNIRNDPEALAHIEHMENHSQLDRNAGMELHQILDPNSTVFGSQFLGRTLDWADHMTRQVNSQVEGVNRAAFGLAAFRLARDGGKSMTEAHEYSRALVHEMAGNYNAYASAPIFNNPYLRPAMQFKRYAGRMTYQWARTFYKAGLSMAGKLPPEQRAAAYRQLAFMMGTTIFTSGILGLPTEPIKALLNITAPITGFDSQDAERMTYEASMKLLGPELGEFLAKGGFRSMGLGLGERTGYSSLWTSPGQLGNKPSDWYQAFGHFVAGAPGSYAADAAQGLISAGNGLGHLVKGHNTEASNQFGNAFEKLFPSKVVADITIAARRAMGGPMYRGQSGIPQGVQPTAAETIMQGFGIQPARMQRVGEQRQAMKDDMRNIANDRKEAERIYAQASPRERTSIQRQLIENFNDKYPTKQFPEIKPLTIADLFKAQRREEARSSGDPSMLGVTMSRRQQAMLPRYRMYNTQ